MSKNEPTWRLYWSGCVVLALSCGGSTPTPRLDAGPDSSLDAAPDAPDDTPTVVCERHAPEVATFALFETACTLEVEVDDVFDPARVALWGELASPTGTTVEIPGFATREYERSLVDGVEQVTAAGELEWRVRFTLTAPGAWRWRWRVELPDGARTSEWQDVMATEPEPDRHGFLRRSPADPRHLRFDDGAPYFAVGENLAWYDSRGTYAYDDWLADLEAQGATYIRIWMPRWAFGLEAIERGADGQVVRSSLGDYRLDRAWQLDHVLESAGARGMQVMLTLQNHGEFSEDINPEWSESPYNAANGGPISTPAEFFVDEEARELFRRRVRYVVARWGYATQILAWELWNEVDNTTATDQAAVVAWHREMAGELRRLDPYDHLITTSTYFIGEISGLEAALFSLDEMDLAQLHLYGGVLSPNIDFTTEVALGIARLAQHGKPVLAAELGVRARGPAETLLADPQSSGLHDLMWSGVFAGTFGSGMSWWWDNVVDPGDLYFHLGPIATLTRDVAFDREGFAAGGAAVVPENLQAWGLRGTTTTLVWIKNRDNLWFDQLDDSAVEGAVLTLTGVPDGSHRADWIDTYGEASPPSELLLAEQGSMTLAVPTFARDIALRLSLAAD